MAVSEAKKAADWRWQRKNTKVFGVKMPITEAEALQAACAAHGVTPHSVFLAAARDYIRANTDAGTMEGGETV